MPYDDDPYWGGFQKPKQAENSPIAPRSQHEAGIVSSKPPRAPKPSPLLEGWLRERGLAVK